MIGRMSSLFSARQPYRRLSSDLLENVPCRQALKGANTKKNYWEKIMKSVEGTPKKPNSAEKRLYIRPELKKCGELKDMTAAGSPDGMISGNKFWS